MKHFKKICLFLVLALFLSAFPVYAVVGTEGEDTNNNASEKTDAALYDSVNVPKEEADAVKDHPDDVVIKCYRGGWHRFLSFNYISAAHAAKSCADFTGYQRESDGTMTRVENVFVRYLIFAADGTVKAKVRSKYTSATGESKTVVEDSTIPEGMVPLIRFFEDLAEAKLQNQSSNMEHVYCFFDPDYYGLPTMIYCDTTDEDYVIFQTDFRLSIDYGGNGKVMCVTISEFRELMRLPSMNMFYRGGYSDPRMVNWPSWHPYDEMYNQQATDEHTASNTSYGKSTSEPLWANPMASIDTSTPIYDSLHLSEEERALLADDPDDLVVKVYRSPVSCFLNPDYCSVKTVPYEGQITGAHEYSQLEAEKLARESESVRYFVYGKDGTIKIKTLSDGVVTVIEETEASLEDAYTLFLSIRDRFFSPAAAEFQNIYCFADWENDPQTTVIYCVKEKADCVFFSTKERPTFFWGEFKEFQDILTLPTMGWIDSSLTDEYVHLWLWYGTPMDYKDKWADLEAEKPNDTTENEQPSDNTENDNTGTPSDPNGNAAVPKEKKGPYTVVWITLAALAMLGFGGGCIFLVRSKRKH